MSNTSRTSPSPTFPYTSHLGVLDMGGPPGPERSSLDRLKALDGLPNTAAQLEEIRALCTHWSRAEMSLRWLLGKLKTSSEMRQDAATWDLLSSCLRLLSPQRVASLLAQNGFVDALQAIFSDSDPSFDTLSALARLMHLLLGLAQGNDGAPLKSVLMINNSVAATICGHWFQKTYEGCHESPDLLVERAVLDPALHLWSLRKKTDADDELFSPNCLVPVLLLLTVLQDDKASITQKRKRGDKSSRTGREYRQSLESLIANHVILPARTVFLRKDGQSSRRASATKAKSPQPAIRERLGPLKMAILSGDSEKTLEAVPAVLDIALRSTSTPTPRHRTSERPWIEEVFSALRSCFASQPREAKNAALSLMIQVLHRQGTVLSSSILSEIVNDHGLLWDESEASTDWQLIANVIQLDANVFNDRTLLQSTFESISSEIDIGQAASGEEDLLTNGIMVPIMKAYARSRNLRAFAQIWHSQLSKPLILKKRSVWSNLGIPFAAVLEESLPSDQILNLFDDFESGVAVLASEGKNVMHDPETHCKLHADLTLLEALVRGIQGDEMKIRVQARVDAVLHNLLKLGDNDAADLVGAIPGQFWRILAQIFQLWFPFWAAGKDRAQVSERGTTMLSGDLFQKALSHCHPDAGSEDQAHVYGAAQAFVAVVCDRFQAYDEDDKCSGLCGSAIEHLGKAKSSALPVLMTFPGFIQKLLVKTRIRLFSDVLIFAIETTGRDNLSVNPAVAALQDSLSHDTLWDWIRVCISHLKNECDGKHDASHELVPLSALSKLNMISLESEQRIEMLDAAAALAPLQQKSYRHKQIQARLATILCVLNGPRLESELQSDASGLWNLAKWLNFDDEQNDNLSLFEEVVRSVIKSWLATQDKKQSREVLIQLSRHIKEHIRSLSKKRESDAPDAELVLVKTAIAALEDSAREELKPEFSHRDAKTVDLWRKALLKDVKSLLSPSGKRKSNSGAALAQVAHLRLALQALVALPDHFWTSLDSKEEIVNLCQSVFEAAHGKEPIDTLDTGVLVATFQLSCKRAEFSGDVLTSLAERSLRYNLEPTEHHIVLLAYEDTVRQASLDWKIAAINSFEQDKLLQSFSALLLLRKATLALSKEDMESAAKTVAFDLLHHTLQAAFKGHSVQVRHTALQTLVEIVKTRPFLLNQHGIEQMLTTMCKILETPVSGSELYLDLCNLLAALFTQHRARLQGRFHMVVTLFHGLITCLFQASKNAVRHAHALARLLESFCNPVVRPKKNSSALVDEARKAQAYAGQYARHILHDYCSAVLTGTLGEGVRDALLQGLWAVINAIETNNAEGIKSLSAAMNNSERAVLRSLYEDYKRSGKWEGL